MKIFLGALLDKSMSSWNQTDLAVESIWFQPKGPQSTPVGAWLGLKMFKPMLVWLSRKPTPSKPRNKAYP